MFSGHVFNATIVLCGAGVVLFACAAAGGDEAACGNGRAHRSPRRRRRTRPGRAARHQPLARRLLPRQHQRVRPRPRLHRGRLLLHPDPGVEPVDAARHASRRRSRFAPCRHGDRGDDRRVRRRVRQYGGVRADRVQSGVLLAAALRAQRRPAGRGATALPPGRPKDGQHPPHRGDRPACSPRAGADRDPRAGGGCSASSRRATRARPRGRAAA